MTLAGRLEDGQRYLEAARRLDPRVDEYAGYVAARAQFSAGHFAEAAATTETYLVKSPKDPAMRILLAAAYAELGRIPEVEQQLQKADETYNAEGGDPFTMLWARVDFPFKAAADTERLAAALRKAGVPELQFGYDASSPDRLTGQEIKSLLLGHTARYRNLENPGFTAVTSFTAEGAASLKNIDGEQTGHLAVHENGLCMMWEQERECAVIFRNPGGTREEGNEYFWVNPWTHFAFIVE